MKKFIAGACLATAISTAAVPAAFAETQTGGFTDISNSYAKDAIQELYNKGIVAGVTNDKFDPKGKLTRAQFAKMIVMALDLDTDATQSSFTDVKGWAIPYVEAAKKAGIIAGISSEKFDPNATVTREMSVTMQVRALQTMGKLNNGSVSVTFKDANKVSAWAKDSVALAVKYNLIKGNPDGTLDPAGVANREMAAMMGVNLLKAMPGVVAEQAPLIKDVSIKSSNANPAFAKVGDTVTLTFKTEEQVTKLGTFKINGSNLTSFVSEGSGSDWTNTATYVLEDSDPAGLVNFQINVKNAQGYYSITTEATNDGSSVTVKNAPAISNVNLVSGNATPNQAVVGDTVTLTFTTKEQVSKLGSFKMYGNNPDSFASEEQADHTWKNVAKYTIQSSDPRGAFTFQINVKNGAGLYCVTTEATTDGSAVEVLEPAAS